MKRGPFGKALKDFLIAAGHFGDGPRWIADLTGFDERNTRRWLDTVVPSRTTWDQFTTCMKRACKQNPKALQALDRATEVRRLILRDRKFQTKEQPSDESDDRPADLLEPSEDMLARFLADTRIAAQVSTGSGAESLYLDTLYVHREKQEEIILRFVREYVDSPEPREGRWISIVGDAGHGKTSLLWYVAQECQGLCALIFPVQALQLSPDAIARLAHGLPRKQAFVFILDTLDLLVGVDDRTLAGSINSIRALGGLLITTCRGQEIQLLAQAAKPDKAVDLDRFAPGEAHVAIRRFVDKAYPRWPIALRESQAENVWNLLDSRRRVQDLSFEPLVLRMIFEAYVPDGIPTDINTQRVYDHFWIHRVHGDRAAKTVEERHARAVLCMHLAGSVYFEEESHTERVIVEQFLAYAGRQSFRDPLRTIESLVSSGVLRWWQLRAGIGFFHQTFLEYAGATAILNLYRGAARDRCIAGLLADVELARLFRVPVLKQLMIQAADGDEELFNRLCDAVCAMQSPIAARLALEVLGKVANPVRLRERVLRWNQSHPELLRAVATEVLRYYPATRVNIALELLEPHLSEDSVGEICFICAAYFAPMTPEAVIAFLMDEWRTAPTMFKSDEASLKNALVATFKAGCAGALDALYEVLPSLSVGVQSGALDDLAVLWSSETGTAAGAFLARMFDSLASQDANEPRAAYVRAFRALSEKSPAELRREFATIRARRDTTTEATSAIFIARLIGVADPTESEVKSALRDLFSKQHVKRLCATQLLREAVKDHPEILDRLLTAGSSFSNEQLNSAYEIASGSTDANRLFQILDRWDLPERGAGNAFRALMKSAAEADPERTLAWLRARIPHAQSAAKARQVVVGFQAVMETAPDAVLKADAHLVIQLGFDNPRASDETKRTLCATAGWIASIDPGLGDDLFRRVFATRNRGFINAALGSLRQTGSPELVGHLFDLVLRFTHRVNSLVTLEHFLAVIADRNEDVRVAVLRKLREHRDILKRLDSPGVVSNVLKLLKSTVKYDVPFVLELAEMCPLLNDGNVASFSSILDNASYGTNDPETARKILARLLELAKTASFKMRNSLHRALPRLDRLLAQREAVTAVVTTILNAKGWSEAAQEQLVRAAKNMDTWEQEDDEEILRSNAPARVKAVLLR